MRRLWGAGVNNFHANQGAIVCYIEDCFDVYLFQIWRVASVTEAQVIRPGLGVVGVIGRPLLKNR